LQPFHPFIYRKRLISRAVRIGGEFYL